MRLTGLEPVRQRHTPLKRACLPVPAQPHDAKVIVAPRTFTVNSSKREKKRPEKGEKVSDLDCLYRNFAPRSYSTGSKSGGKHDRVIHRTFIFAGPACGKLC